MAESFRLRYGREYEGKLRKLEGEIKERVDGCLEPRCWELKDPNDNGRIYLKRKVTTDGKGQYTYIRRYLFCDVYKHVPARHRIDMACGNTKCVNPAHATYKGFQRPHDQVKAMFERGWLTEKQEEAYFR